MKKVLKKGMAFIMAFVMCLSMTNAVAYAEENAAAQEVGMETVQSSWDDVTRSSTYVGENIKVTFTLTDDWNEGYNANVKIENTGNSVIENWYLSFALNNELTTIWNAEVVSCENGQYVVKNANWNADIPVGKYVEFGISVNEKFAGFPSTYKLLGESTQLQEAAYSVEYVLDSDWGSGFTARMLLTNNAEKTLEDWTLEFDFDREITSIWDAVIENHEGNHYVIKNAGHNANVATGSAISFGFNGEGGTAELLPGGFALNSYLLSDNSEHEDIDVELNLQAFSEYGLNILTWGSLGKNTCEVFRKSDGMESIYLEEVTGANYYVDTTAEAGEEYEYQIVVRGMVSDEDKYSNRVFVLTTEETTVVPENPDERVLSLLNLMSDYSNLSIIYGKNDWEGRITENIGLQEKGECGSDITWESSDIKLVSNQGKVCRLQETESVVTLTATLYNGNYSMQKEYLLTVVRADQHVSEVNDVTWEDIKNMNEGTLPEIQFDNAGDVKRICGKYTDLRVFTENDAKASLNGLRSILGIEDAYEELQLERESEDSYGKVFCFTQQYQGIPILGADIVVHADKNGETTYLSSSYIKDVMADMEVSVSQEDLMEIAGSEFRAGEIEASLFLYREDIEDDTLVLCYEVETEREASYRLFVDAKTGEVVYSEPMERSAIAKTATATDMNGVSQTIPVTYDFSLFKKSLYYLQDKNRNIEICDGTGISNGIYSPMTSIDNNWKDKVAVTAYKNVMEVYDFFQGLNWKGYNGKNGDMQVVVHYQERIGDYHELKSMADLCKVYRENSIPFPETLTSQQMGYINNGFPSLPSEAIQNIESEIVKALIKGLDEYAKENPQKTITISVMGDVCNAYAYRKDGKGILEFGDGDGVSTRSYASDIDTVAHEFTHNVTKSKFSDFISSNQAGAINEAYSDIFGELIDNDGDWFHGADNYIDKELYSRNLEAPEETITYQYPSKAYSREYKPVCLNDKHEEHNGCDRGNVHNNSTIISHAAYLMYKKGVTNEELSQLWFKSYDFYYDRITPNFYECREAVLLAAKQIGLSDEKIDFVKEAFDEVNITGKRDIKVTVLDALNNTPITDCYIALVSADKETCRLQGSCCADSSCGMFSCDPETCLHKCNEWCDENCELRMRCCTVRNYQGRRTDEDGIVQFTNVAKGYHRIQFTGNGEYAEHNERIWVDEITDNITVMLERPYSSSVEGRITIADEDTDIGNNEPLSFAKVTLTKKSGTEELVKEVYTSNDGLYNINNIPAGDYELRVEGYQYFTVIQTLSVEENQTIFANLVIESIPTKYEGLGHAGGVIKDAYTGLGVEGLTLEVYKDIDLTLLSNREHKEIVESLTTDEGGNYITSALDAGNYTIVVTDEREVSEDERYNQSLFVVKVLGNTTILSQNWSVSGKLRKNQMRIVLTWGANPRDLDSHLSIVTEEGASGHVYYGDKKFYVDGTECANLDLDDTSGYGPETTTIFTEIDGTFTFYVYHFSGTGSLSESGATVSVYTGEALVPMRTYYVPQGSGRYWDVFVYDSLNGTITDLNKIR